MLLIQFKINKMLVRLSIIFLTISTMVKAEVTELLDLPLKMSDGSLELDTFLLTHGAEGVSYSVNEFVFVSESAITGKIQVWNKKDSYDIHYQFDRSGKDSKERLVIHGNDCTLYNHSKMTQNANLFGTNNPLRDLILLMGPSIIYRLDGQSAVLSEAIQHGLSRKLITTAVNKTLEITLYFVAKELLIEFNGYDRSSKSPEVRLSMKIAKQKSFTPIQISDLKYKTQFSPGIGCPNYLIKSERNPIPNLLTKYLNFTMYEEIEGSTNNRSFSEIMASGKHLLMRLKTNLTGVKTEVIYDNELGIILTLEEGGRCQMTIGDRNSPGRDEKGYFKLENLFYFDGDFNYMGKDYFVNQFKFPVDAWESVQFNVDFQGNKVDKIVVTQFFVESPNSIIFNGSALVQTMISIYDSVSSKKSYALAKRIIRGYSNIRTIEAGEKELYDYFMPNNCKYLLNDRKVTLNFKIACEALNTDCIKLANRFLVQFRMKFIDAILLYQTISPLRVDDIQYHSSDSQISMRVTFLDKPNFDDLMKPEKMLVSNETFDVARTLFANNERECLDQLGDVRGLFSVGIWRSSDSFCGYLRKFEDFKEDAKNGESCDVYILPLEKYYHISHESSLEYLQRSFLSYKFRTFSMKDPDSHKSVSYKLIDIVKVPEFEKDDKVSDINSFYTIAGNSKLKKDDKTTLVVPGVSTFAECLRVCQNSEKLECNSFSFCSDSDPVDCRVSTLRESNFTDTTNIETDSKCSIFTVNALRYYSKVLKRKFKTQISLESSLSATSCAQKCLSSRDCISFQQCGYFCSFNGFYTDESTVYDEECVIYYPKISHEFRRIGNEKVPEVIHTEMNLELGQCALLCHGLSYGDNGCKSFNYCPKNIDRMESSCSLTKYSVKNSNTNITEGGHCSNYSLTSFPFFKNYKKSNEVQVSHEYRNTGNKIVSEVIHTEMNLNLDQCASLCYVISHGDFGCISFNYCPRNVNQIESSCSLTRYSVESSDTNSTEEAHCSNYELITQPSRKTNEESSEIKLIKGTSGSSAFGIIMMFLVIVSFLVFSAPCVYEKIKPRRVFAQLNESLTWTKQVNEQPGATKINMSDF